jgi:hypothetical protein
VQKKFLNHQFKLNDKTKADAGDLADAETQFAKIINMCVYYSVTVNVFMKHFSP